MWVQTENEAGKGERVHATVTVPKAELGPPPEETAPPDGTPPPNDGGGQEQGED